MMRTDSRRISPLAALIRTRNTRFFSIGEQALPSRRIAMFTMFESLHVLHPAESAILARYFYRTAAARRVRNDVTLVTDAIARSDGRKTAPTNAPRLAHATEALMSRLPTMNG